MGNLSLRRKKPLDVGFLIRRTGTPDPKRKVGAEMPMITLAAFTAENSRDGFKSTATARTSWASEQNLQPSAAGDSYCPSPSSTLCR